jgi:hypothetical protein
MFVLTMIGVSIYGWNKGNVQTLLAPIARKPYNIICGVGEAKDFPYLFFIPLKQEDLL